MGEEEGTAGRYCRASREPLPTRTSHAGCRDRKQMFTTVYAQVAVSERYLAACKRAHRTGRGLGKPTKLLFLNGVAAICTLCVMSDPC